MRLTSLESLRIEDCGVLQALPACVEQWTALQSLSLAFLPNFTELPPTVAALTNLHELVICICAIKELPALIGELTKLTTLRVMDCALIDVPWSIESLTALRDLRLDVITAAHPHCRAFTKLACSLPALRLLESLELHGLDEGDALAISRSQGLAPPLPCTKQLSHGIQHLLAGAGAPARGRRLGRQCYPVVLVCAAAQDGGVCQRSACATGRGVVGVVAE